MPDTLESLQAQRARLYQELPQIGDLRRGSIAANYRCCGKPGCVCNDDEHPGHGPQYLLMTKVEGRSRAKNLKPGPELQKVQQEVANHQKLRERIRQIIEVNEKICDLRPIGQPVWGPEKLELKKKSCRPSKRKSPRK